MHFEEGGLLTCGWNDHGNLGIPPPLSPPLSSTLDTNPDSPSAFLTSFFERKLGSMKAVFLPMENELTYFPKLAFGFGGAHVLCIPSLEEPLSDEPVQLKTMLP